MKRPPKREVPATAARRARRRGLIALAGLVSLGGCTLPAPTIDTGPNAEISVDGLYRVRNSRFGLVFVKPGTAFSEYDSVLIDPVEIAYKRTPGFYALREADLTTVRRYFDRAMERELAATGFHRATVEGERTLRITPYLIDLIVNAPDRIPAGRSRIYAMSSAEMTLIAEACDSTTGEILARVADRGSSRSGLERVTFISVVDELEGQIDAWARLLRDRLEAVRESESQSVEPE